MEVIGNGVVTRRDEIHLLGYFARQVVGHGYNEGIVRHVTGVQHSLQVVEVQLLDAAQVLTYDADGRTHVSLVENRVTLRIGYGTDVGDGRYPVRCLIFIRLVLAGGGGQCGTGSHCKPEAFE